MGITSSGKSMMEVLVMRGTTLVAMILSVVSLTAGLATAQETAEVEARAALDEYFLAWNAADNEAIKDISNFPRLSLGANGQVVVRESPDEVDTDFVLLRQAEGWDYTTLDLVEAIHVAPDKVHYKIVSSRRGSTGIAYRTGPALYVFTKQNGHWGLQLQSILPATFTAQ